MKATPMLSLDIVWTSLGGKREVIDATEYQKTSSRGREMERQRGQQGLMMICSRPKSQGYRLQREREREKMAEEPPSISGHDGGKRKVMVVAGPGRESAGALQWALTHAAFKQYEIILLYGDLPRPSHRGRFSVFLRRRS